MALRRMAIAGALLGIGGAVAVACGGDDSAAPLPDAGKDGTAATDGTTQDTNAPDTAPGDTGTDAGAVDRGPTTIPFNGDPNGLWWDYGVGAALYIADNKNNAIAKWTDNGGFGASIALPATPDGGPASLGQVLRLLDGTLLVTEFGFGQYGAIVVVDKTGDAGVVTGTVDGGPAPLSVKKRRIGLALLSDGTIVDTYFTPTPDGGPRVGAVAKVNLLAGTEKDFLTGLMKPVGVVQNEGKLYVTDQDFGYVIRARDGGLFVDPEAGIPDDAGADADETGADAAAPDAAGAPSVFASIASPDLICQGPDGALFVGSSAGVVYKIDRAGAVTSFQSGLKSARGCAYDGAHKRLFVAEHDPAGTANAIRIFPVP